MVQIICFIYGKKQFKTNILNESLRMAGMQKWILKKMHIVIALFLKLILHL